MTMLVASVGRIVGMVVIVVVVVPVRMRMRMSVVFRIVIMGMGIVIMGMSILTMVIAVTIHHAEARRADTRTQNRAGIDPHICFLIRVQNEASKRRTNLLDRQTCIYERAENHVPGRARETVKVENGRHVSRVSY